MSVFAFFFLYFIATCTQITSICFINLFKATCYSYVSKRIRKSFLDWQIPHINVFSSNKNHIANFISFDNFFFITLQNLNARFLGACLMYIASRTSCAKQIAAKWFIVAIA